MQPAVTSATPAPITTLRTLAVGLISAVVMLGVVAFAVLDSTDYPPVWLAAALGLLAVLAHAVAQTFGYRAPALSPADPPEQARAAGRAAYQGALMVRFAVCEAVAVVALVAAFAVQPSTAKTYLVGGTLSLLLLLWHVWPSERTISRVEAQLDRDGGHSDLGATLHGRVPGSALR
jgi:hypothetical protein